MPNVPRVDDGLREHYEAIVAAERKKIEARNAEVLRRLKEGQNAAAISTELGISRQRVEQIRHVLGFPTPATLARAAREKRIAALAAEGKTLTEIASAIGVSYNIVRDAACRAGTKVRREPSRPRLQMAAAYLGIGGRTGSDIACICDILPPDLFRLRARLIAEGVPLPKLPDGRASRGRKKRSASCQRTTTRN